MSLMFEPLLWESRNKLCCYRASLYLCSVSTVVKMGAFVLLKNNRDSCHNYISRRSESTKSDKSSERGYDMDVCVLVGRHYTCLGAAVDKLSLI